VRLIIRSETKLTQEVYCKQNFLYYHDFTEYRALYLQERRNLKSETLGDFFVGIIMQWSSATADCCLTTDSKRTGIYNSKISKTKATYRINKWINTVEQTGVNCFNKFATTLLTYQTEVINYFKGRHTSGFVERINNKVKTFCCGAMELHAKKILFLDMIGHV